MYLVSAHSLLRDKSHLCLLILKLLLSLLSCIIYDIITVHNKSTLIKIPMQEVTFFIREKAGDLFDCT